MRRIVVPRRGAVALVVVFLSFAVSAPALAEVEGQPQPEAPGAEQTPEQQPAPDQAPEPAPEPAPEEEQPPTEPSEENGEAPSEGPTDEEKSRYDRYCTMEDAEPSHSDKQFCEEFETKYGGTGSETGSGPTDEEKSRYDRYCTMEDAEPSHSDKEFCEEYEAKYGTNGSTGETGSTSTAAEQVAQESDSFDEADSGPLAFTGLDLWQLGLIALALIGGGIGIRRLLTR